MLPNFGGTTTWATLALVAFLGVSCGGSKQPETDRAVMDVEFSIAELAIAQEVVKSARDGSGSLEDPTRSYIELTRRYADELGEDEVKRRLADKATEVQDWCPSCAAAFDRERETYD